MAITRKEEARALNAEEKELVEKSHHPHLQDVPDSELSQLAKLLRDRRSKARDQPTSGAVRCAEKLPQEALQHLRLMKVRI